MQVEYNSIYCLHALDDTTKFLSDFNGLGLDNYIAMHPNEESINQALGVLESIKAPALIIFLGHGQSTGLYAPHTETFEKRVMINSNLGDTLFKNKDVILLSCKSAEFIQRLHSYKNIIGFGNILSSSSEVHHEAEFTGRFRRLSDDDIDYFNASYVNALICSIKLLLAGKVSFKDLTWWISYYINKEINAVLRLKDKDNRVEISRLLFEFRNEMLYKSSE